MITFSAFVERSKNQYIDVDGGFPKENPYQCWDVAAAYARDVVGVSPPYMRTTDGGIYSSYADFPAPLPVYFDRISLSQGSPRVGDLLVFNRTWGSGLGHVGLIISINGAGFVLLEQNNPLGTYTHTRGHPISDLQTAAGVLRPKVLVTNSAGESMVRTAPKDWWIDSIYHECFPHYAKTQAEADATPGMVFITDNMVATYLPLDVVEGMDKIRSLPEVNTRIAATRTICNGNPHIDQVASEVTALRGASPDPDTAQLGQLIKKIASK